MTKMTMCVSAAAVMALAIGWGAMASAQDTGGLGFHAASTATIYTSPLHASDVSCNVLNKTDHSLQVEIHLVYTDGTFIDDSTVTSTTTLASKATTALASTSLSLTPNALLYCRFSFSGGANQVRAIIVGKQGDSAVSSEAR